MAYVRLFRRVRIAPGLTMNLTKAGPSFSLGLRGAHITVGRRGVTRTVGLPGTGVFYTSRSGHHTGVHTGEPFAVPEASPATPRHVALGCLLVLAAVLVVLGLIGRFLGPGGKGCLMPVGAPAAGRKDWLLR